MLKSEKDIINFVQNNEYMMNALKVAADAKLPGWFIGAGFIRNTVWDLQHGYVPSLDFNDLDLGYYDDVNLSEENDRQIGKLLAQKLPVNWEVVNQAYAHQYNNVPQYSSAVDGLAHWVETATSVALTLDKDGKVVVIAPWGVDDLLNLKLKLVPFHENSAYYKKLFIDRITSKQWQKKWPKLELVS